MKYTTPLLVNRVKPEQMYDSTVEYEMRKTRLGQALEKYGVIDKPK